MSTRWPRLAAALALTGLAPACGDDAFTTTPADPEEPTATIEVTVVPPEETPGNVLASTHLWVLTLDEGSDVTCAGLVGGEVEPYDLGARTTGDVATFDPAARLVADGVPVGPALVYVEGVDHRGQVELAGCAAVDVVEPTTTATITLGKARVFDCADPATEDGAPCDDDRLCTVGETCQAGACDGGLARSCTHLADPCNAATCDEDVGCVATPLANGTPCDDGLFCTDGDTCQEGSCAGPPLDCDAVAETCQVAIGCDEAAQLCLYDTAFDGTPCDDGSFCTVDDTCDDGFCGGGARDCAAEAPACQVAVGCDDASEACLFDDAFDGTSCDDGVFCTDDDTCESGACAGGPPRDCSSLDVGCVVGACDEVTESCVEAPADLGTSCSDGLFCTTADACDGDGTCTGTPLVCPGGTTCLPQVCDEVSNACEPDPAPPATDCDDADVCTENDACNGAGVCTGTVVPDCP